MPLIAAATSHQEASSALLVALGAVPGAWLRFLLVNQLEPVLPRRHWGTLGVNLLACFALGLLVGLLGTGDEGSKKLMLLVGTGFLGSFSTYSSFIAELNALLFRRQFREALGLIGGSIGGGLLALSLGLSVGGAV